MSTLLRNNLLRQPTGISIKESAETIPERVMDRDSLKRQLRQEPSEAACRDSLQKQPVETACRDSLQRQPAEKAFRDSLQGQLQKNTN